MVLVGLLSTLLGLLLAVAFGPDNRLDTGPHPLRSDGSVITTGENAVAYAGPRVDLTVTTDGDRSLFVGVAHHVDVTDLLGDTPRTRVDRLDLPWKTDVSEVRGAGSPLGSPLDADWWIAQDQGRGTATVEWTLAEDGGDVLIMDLDGQDGLSIDVVAALVVPGIFVVGAAMTVIGLGVAVFGWAVLTTRVSPRGAHADRTRSDESGRR